MCHILQLRERMSQWHLGVEHQRIGDIIVKFSPFFKMYTEYVKNFDNAITTINNLYQKNARFQALMDDIHVRRHFKPPISLTKVFIIISGSSRMPKSFPATSHVNSYSKNTKIRNAPQRLPQEALQRQPRSTRLRK